METASDTLSDIFGGVARSIVNRPKPHYCAYFAHVIRDALARSVGGDDCITAEVGATNSDCVSRLGSARMEVTDFQGKRYAVTVEELAE